MVALQPRYFQQAHNYMKKCIQQYWRRTCA